MPTDGYFPDGFWPDGYFPPGYWPDTDAPTPAVSNLIPPPGTKVVIFNRSSCIVFREGTSVPTSIRSQRISSIVLDSRAGKTIQDSSIPKIVI
jgi:hypothetical protein